jgi:Acetoacetate decarboxylase (ADC)
LELLSSNKMPMTRREFVQISAWGFAGTAVAYPQDGSAKGFQRLRVRFLTTPERLARALPNPLEAGPAAEMFLEYARSTPGAANVNPLSREPLVVCSLLAAVRHEGKPGYLLLARWTPSEQMRLNGREYLGENVKYAQVDFEKRGALLRASVRRHGALLHSIETHLSDAPGAFFGDPQYLYYRYRLNPDWTAGPLGPDDVELWLASGEAAPAKAGADPVFSCDLAATKFAWPEASLLDPCIEFPVVEILGASYQESPVPIPSPFRRTPARVSKVDTKQFENFSLWNYDRPVSNGKPWLPEGWRQEATALRLSDAELAAYRDRQQIRLGPFSLIDLRLAVPAANRRLALPPNVEIGLQPMLRVMALRVEQSDVSPDPYSEVWLMVQCSIADRRGWYVLSHVTSGDGDTTFGRETFGYPSRIGAVQASVAPEEFRLQASRQEREFLYAEGNATPRSLGTSLSGIPILGLRAGPFAASGDAPGQIIEQDWHYQGQFYTVNLESVVVELPDRPVPGFSTRTDPWFEFKPFQIVSAVAMNHGSMQRGPGQVVATVPDARPFYLERCDGLLPGSDLSSARPPTFRIGAELAPRS